MTDGILLNEMTSDYLLSEYSVIIIDEAHERKINTDLLLGLLSRVVNIRAKNSEKERKLNPNKKKYENNPLRLIIMSATLRVEDFTHNKWLFPKKINVINVESRQFPVSIYYNKITPDNYMDEALKKCKKIHKTLPTGDVLVFLTGEKEIKEFCYKLEIEFSKNEDQSDEFNKDENIINNFDSKEINLSKPKEKRNIFDPDSDEEMVVEEEDEENKHQELKKEHLLTNKELPLCVAVYPLFSKLCFAEQERIFQSHAENIR